MTQKFTSDIVIGLEIHIELDTKTKLFCSCPTKGDETPNSRTCPVCLGHPGSKPVLNKKAIEYGIKLALATKSKIAKELIFSRKSYFYPDMSKNYQITQYEIPLATEGKLKLPSGKEIGLIRIHMEEDPASLVHQGSMQQSPFVLVDYNRSGNPLLEIVTKPEMTSPDEARDFMKELITVLSYLKIFDENNGIIKADANISIKESGYIRSEVKNVTGFKEIESALKYEVERQKQEAKSLKQETRGWDSEKGVTFSLRSKETEEDYGYIIDPDLVKTNLTKDMMEKIEKEMPELAHEKLEKLKQKHGHVQSMSVIVKDPDLAEFFEKVTKNKDIDEKLASHWVELELKRVLNYNKKTLKESRIRPEHFVDILLLIKNKKITEKIGKKLIEKLVEEDFNVNEYVKKQGLEVVTDEKAIEKLCIEAIKNNQKAVDEYKSGKEKALQFLIGQVMRSSKGKAKPAIVREIILRKIV